MQALSCRSLHAANGPSAQQPAQQPAQQQQQQHEQQGQDGKRKRGASEHFAATASASASATVSAITNSSSSEQAAFTGGLSNSKIISRQGPPEVPSNSKNNPQTPSRTEIVILIYFLKVWSRSDRERTVYIYNILCVCMCMCGVYV